MATTDGKIIKLLPNNRVLLEVVDPTNHKETKKMTSTILADSLTDRKICGLNNLLLINQSYGTYKRTDSKLILSFVDENPIEKVEIVSSKSNPNKLHVITIDKNLETLHDLKIYQNDKEIFTILSFEKKSQFSLKDINHHLTFEYNGNTKTIELPSKNDLNLLVSINDFKGNNHVKNQKLVFDVSELIEK